MTNRLPGINIQQPWSQLLLNGDKTVETRTYPLPGKYVGKAFWLIETPGKYRNRVAMVVGIIVFETSILYLSRNQFIDDFKRHLVPVDHPLFGFKSDRAKYGWEVAEATAVTPFQPLVRRGIVYTRPFAKHMTTNSIRDVEGICL